MIQKNKARIFVVLSVSLLLRIALDLVVLTRPPWYARWSHDPSGTFFPTLLLTYLATTVFYLWGCVLLANARGYSGAIVAATWVAAAVVGYWIPFVPLALPLAVILSSPDKNRIRSRKHHRTFA